MREYLKWVMFIGITILGVPIIVSYRTGYNSDEYIKAIESSLENKNKWTDIIQEEALVGILAKQLPPSFELEAIKTQAVITRTYMARRILGIEQKGILTGYSVDEMKELWGSDYDEIYDVYSQAVTTTSNEIIAYKDDIIEPLYHKSSSGVTRDAKTVYKKDIPYLKSVESSMDESSKQIKLLKKDFIEYLEEQYEDIVLTSDNIENQVQIIGKDTGGYVVSLQIGNLIIDGEEFRKLMNLPSSCFEIYVSDNSLIFDVRGEGDGIGLSQNGADILAKQGMTYEQIIKYYYTDVEIQKREIQK